MKLTARSLRNRDGNSIPPWWRRSLAFRWSDGVNCRLRSSPRLALEWLPRVLPDPADRNHYNKSFHSSACLEASDCEDPIFRRSGRHGFHSEGNPERRHLHENTENYWLGRIK